MEPFDFITYMKFFAEKLINFQPYTNNFYKASSVAKLEELLQNITRHSTGLILVCVTNADGVIGDAGNGVNYTDIPSHQFYILKHVKQSDADARELAVKEAKNAGKKIIAKMLYDKRNSQNGLLFLNLNRIPYFTVGPLGNNFHGVIFDFTLVQKPDLVYNVNDYLPDE